MRRKREKNGQSRALKCALKSMLRNDYQADFIALVTTWCKDATVISVLASLFFLYQTNRAFDVGDQAFFNGDGHRIIWDCFHSILFENHQYLPPEFREMTQGIPDFQWPQRHGMSNAFNYLVEQYITNAKNNIRVWAYSRVKTFFALRRYEMNLLGHNITEIDVKNATKAVMFNNIVASDNVNRLLQHAHMIGIPIGHRFCDIVRGNWFRTIPIFINIQRAVFEHHQRYELLHDRWRAWYRDRVNNEKPRVPRPPKIRNFKVIPIHDCKMKHIRIDWHAFYEMACKLKALKLKKGFYGRDINISKDEYENNVFFCWNRIFDMDKIVKVGNGNKVIVIKT